MGLLDLSVIAELTEFELQFIHYAVCLSRLPQGILEFNDVLDTFGRYFHNGLNFDFELSHPPAGIGLLTHTNGFGDYFHHEAGQRQTPAEKPKMALDADTYAELETLCETAAPRFVDQACRVLDKWRAAAVRKT